MRTTLTILLAVAFAAVLAAPASSTTAATGAGAPAIVLKDDTFGRILATRSHQALYTWNVERRDGKVRCTGACARLWPPLVVKSAAAVPRRLPGVRGTFGVVRRPGGALQVTFRGLPIYTYVHEGPDQVLCNDVDGWFVARA